MPSLLMAKQIFSHQVEKHALSGLLQYPKIFPDIDPFVTEKDFYQDAIDEFKEKDSRISKLSKKRYFV